MTSAMATGKAAMMMRVSCAILDLVECAVKEQIVGRYTAHHAAEEQFNEKGEHVCAASTGKHTRVTCSTMTLDMEKIHERELFDIISKVNRRNGQLYTICTCVYTCIYANHLLNKLYIIRVNSDRQISRIYPHMSFYISLYTFIIGYLCQDQ